MFVIDVIPLASHLPQGTLSYRSRKRLAAGSLVFVPLRSKNIPALVIGVSSVLEAKASLKAAGFSLRGGSLKTAGRLSESILSAAQEIAAYHAASIGSVLASLVRDVLPDTLPKTFAAGAGHEELFVEDIYEKRIEAYRTLVEKQRARKKATLVVAPTLVEAQRLFETFKNESAMLVTGALRGKRREAALAAVVGARGVLVATPAFAWLPIQHLGAIVIERTSAGGFVSPKRPYLDMRIALGALAKHRELTIAYGDLPLPLEIRPNPSAPVSITLGEPVIIIDPREEQKDAAFAAVPSRMLSAITAAHEAGGRSAVFAVRKGYASAVVCRDCGNVVKDERGAALSLVTLGATRMLRSADGTTKVDADAVCSVCGSWNLLPLGIGVERVIEELKKALPDADIIRFDADVIRTSAQAKSAAKRAEEKGAIVVGTEIVLPFLDPARPFDVAAIASADSLLALPFWRARERLVRIGLTLRERATCLYIATRLPEEIAMSAITHPDREDFFKEESDIRKALSYPPFGHLLVFHAEGPAMRLDEAAARIEKALSPFTGVRLADRIIKRGRFRLSLVAKLKSGTWPDAALADRIAHLPLWISVHIDPESLW